MEHPRSKVSLWCESLLISSWFSFPYFHYFVPSSSTIRHIFFSLFYDSSLHRVFSFFSFFNTSLFIFERGREVQAGRGGAEKEGERILSVGLKLMNREIIAWAQIRSWMLTDWAIWVPHTRFFSWVSVSWGSHQLPKKFTKVFIQITLKTILESKIIPMKE